MPNPRKPSRPLVINSLTVHALHDVTISIDINQDGGQNENDQHGGLHLLKALKYTMSNEEPE
jgi:hypothetical protein